MWRACKWGCVKAVLADAFRAACADVIRWSMQITVVSRVGSGNLKVKGFVDAAL